MPILGINSYAHDSSAALVADDGRVIAAAEEERFTRKKHTGDFPRQAIQFCLKYAGIPWRDISEVAFSFDPWLQFRKRIVYSLQTFPQSLRFSRHSSAVFQPFFLKRKLPGKFPIRYVNHHQAHAASTFFTSPFERAAILTVDGAGEWATTVLSRGEGNKIISLEEINYPHSLGFLYGAVTQFLGFRPCYDEGKVMALAAYGEPSLMKEFEKLVHLKFDGNFRLDLSYFQFHQGSACWHSPKMAGLLGSPRKPQEPIQSRHYDIAATLQAVIEKALLALARRIHQLTKAENLCLAGGVALNCTANGRLLKDSPFKKIFVQPASGDGGTSLGAALWVAHQKLKSRKEEPAHTYLGPDFNDHEIESALSSSQLSYEKIFGIEDRVAELLSEGKNIGWFQGRMEFGPRALGARSILADPRDQAKRDYLNKKIKLRESFRPFGPSVLEEDANDVFEIGQKSPFMLFATQVRSKIKSLIPAVLHHDGSSRIQTVSKQSSPRYWKMIQSFKKKTGIPLVLNTSFNLKDEPIVCRPEDAVASFQRSQLDGLAIGSFLAQRNGH